MNHCRHIALIFVIGILFGVVACQKETIRTENEPDFDNPFDGINDGNFPDPVNIDPESFLGIYNNILSVKCGSNDGACHDGSFEPDFRTLFSAYNTLVYHTPIKNIIESISDGDTTWVYDHRVSPGDPEGSWMYYRITTSDEDLGRMPLYDQPLPEEQIENVRQWILAGAPDPFGNLPNTAIPEPQFFGLMAYDQDVDGPRLDTSRANILEPMIFPANSNVRLYFGIVDYDQNGQLFPGAFLTLNQLRISDHLNDFSTSSNLSLTVTNILDYLLGPVFSTGPNVVPYYHYYDLETSGYTPNTPYYMRVTVQGQYQNSQTIFPDNGSPIYWKTYMSFVVE